MFSYCCFSLSENLDALSVGFDGSLGLPEEGTLVDQISYTDGLDDRMVSQSPFMRFNFSSAPVSTLRNVLPDISSLTN